MATLPFKRLFPRPASNLPAEVTSAIEDTERSSARYNVLYRSATLRKRAHWTGDGVLDISPSGSAILKDTETSQALARQKIPSQRLPLQPGNTVYMANMMIQVQDDTAEEEANADRIYVPTHNSPITSDAARRPYKKPERHTVPAPRPTVPCEECKATGRDCNFAMPCAACVTNHTAYCSHVSPDFTAIHRTPTSFETVHEVASNSCHNCQIFGLECDHRKPCTQCPSRRRAFCTWIDQSGSVTSVLCAAYERSADGQSRDQMILRLDYRGEGDEVWPTWPSPRPSSSTLARLEKRFETSFKGRHGDPTLLPDRYFGVGSQFLKSFH